MTQQVFAQDFRITFQSFVTILYWLWHREVLDMWHDLASNVQKSPLYTEELDCNLWLKYKNKILYKNQVRNCLMLLPYLERENGTCFKIFLFWQPQEKKREAFISEDWHERSVIFPCSWYTRRKVKYVKSNNMECTNMAKTQST